MRKLVIFTLFLFMLMAQSVSATKNPAASATNFKLYKSDSNVFGSGIVVCHLTGGSDCGPLEPSTTYRMEFRIAVSTADASSVQADWSDVSSFTTTNPNNCWYLTPGTYGGTGSSVSGTCSYSGGTLTLLHTTTVSQDSFIWVGFDFTTSSTASTASNTQVVATVQGGGATDTMLGINIIVGFVGALESKGKLGYGWHQRYYVSDFETGAAGRLTGSVDRRWYDWGFKSPQISGRIEDYWSRDSGWWYVSGESWLNFTVWDGANDVVLNQSYRSTTKGLNTTTYAWNSSDDDPGEWRAMVDNGDVNATIKFFVRGWLNVTNITTNATNPLYPNKGDMVEINATLKDNAGNYINWSYRANNGTDITPTNVTAYITGAGEEFIINLTNYEGDGGWRGNFTPQKVGDHMIIVSASDEHNYWVDGRRSQWIYVNGTYLPDYDDFASVGLWMFLRGLDGLSNKLKVFALFASLLGLVFIKVWWRRWVR